MKKKHILLIESASMRPGPIRPGNVTFLARAVPLYHASMRPGPIRPGNAHRGRAWHPPLPGFNEARADSPGKYGRGDAERGVVPLASMRPGPIRPGNNEGRGGPSGYGDASMRPGPIRPGNPGSHRHPAARTGRFNEARADSPGKFHLHPPPLPGGHRFNEARADSPGKLPQEEMTPDTSMALQ